MIFGLTKKEMLYIQLIILVIMFFVSGFAYLVIDDANYISTPKWAVYEPIPVEKFLIAWLFTYLLFNLFFFIFIWIDDGGLKRIKNKIKNP